MKFYSINYTYYETYYICIYMRVINRVHFLTIDVKWCSNIYIYTHIIAMFDTHTHIIIHNAISRVM